MYKFYNGLFFPYHAIHAYKENNNWPTAGVDVSIEIFNEYNQDRADGMTVGCDENGYPCWVKEQLKPIQLRMEIARYNRDLCLVSTSWMVERHRDEIENGLTSTLTENMYKDLQHYRQCLRDWPANDGWPDIDMPMKPAWLT